MTLLILQGSKYKDLVVNVEQEEQLEKSYWIESLEYKMLKELENRNPDEIDFEHLSFDLED